MPGGLASPWGGLGPGQAGKGWGPRDQLQGFGPQALAAQALQRGRGRWQSGGCVVFLPGEVQLSSSKASEATRMRGDSRHTGLKDSSPAPTHLQMCPLLEELGRGWELQDPATVGT